MNITDLLRHALESEASDLHIVAGIPPSLRIDGEIQFLDAEPLSGNDTRAMIMALLNDQQRDRLEHERQLDFSFQLPEVGRFRTSLYFARGELEGSFRVVPPRLKSLHELNLPKVVERLASCPSGLVLVTGPTGVGKTTTMNAMIEMINNDRRVRIITIEDPIEFVHPHRRSVIIQRELDSDTLSFRSALIAALRQDPNIICIGEMRDLETISTALTAAETGHLVISTLHTQSATQTIDRIIDVFPAHQQAQVRMQLANTLQGVICQQLLPLVGERGRVLAYEVLVATPAIRSLIREGKLQQVPNCITTGREEGMLLMDRCIRTLYEQGVISYDTAVSRCHDPITFKSLNDGYARRDWSA
ncbi:MAG: type IV pilus twitching motility protein PilT [Proteobacteria bacterium]|nr:type IV pilus twitching motility protein PilT [Pseudomonadota bacterium]